MNDDYFNYDGLEADGTAYLFSGIIVLAILVVITLIIYV
jgi:hypothetical protein